jgi:hypothetical protein
MPRYFLHIDDGRTWTEDPDGCELPDLKAAEDEARQVARNIVAEAVLVGREPVGHAIIIVDEQGRRLGSVQYRDVLPRTLIGSPEPSRLPSRTASRQGGLTGRSGGKPLK